MSILNNGNTVAPFVSAVVVAAGNSTRMNGVNKQLLLIDGVPVLVRTLKALSDNSKVGEIVVAAREEDIPVIYQAVQEYEIPKVTHIVRGGATRQQSVLNAVNAVSESCEYLLIHDGARPLVTADIIDGTLEAAFEYGAAATGVKVKDTIKKVGPDGFIIGTPDREKLWAVHTPQIFKKSLYIDALRTVADASDFTDDCKLIEEYGEKVQMVEGSYENIKITTPGDVILAEAILRTRNEYD